LPIGTAGQETGELGPIRPRVASEAAAYLALREASTIPRMSGYYASARRNAPRARIQAIRSRRRSSRRIKLLITVSGRDAVRWSTGSLPATKRHGRSDRSITPRGVDTRGRVISTIGTVTGFDERTFRWTRPTRASDVHRKRLRLEYREDPSRTIWRNWAAGPDLGGNPPDVADSSISRASDTYAWTRGPDCGVSSRILAHRLHGEFWVRELWRRGNRAM